MNNSNTLSSLNSHQLEILKLFSREMDEKDLIAIKRLIVKYLAEKVTNMVDDIWEENNWTQEDMDRMLHTHKRTPYNPKN
jgi:hypothetical protein